MADDNLMNQDEIERLLSGASGSPAPKPAKPAPQASQDSPLDQGEIETLLGTKPAEQAASTSPPPQFAQHVDTPQIAQPSKDDDKLLGQDDIEKLLNMAGTAPAQPEARPSTAVKEPPPPQAAAENSVPLEDVEYLLTQAEQALESIGAADSNELPQGVTQFRLQEFSGASASAENATLDLIRDVELDLKIELGRTHMYLEDVLRLRKGSVVPLDKLAGDPVDIFVNGRLIARGEVLVLNDNFCVRVAELIAGTNVSA